MSTESERILDGNGWMEVKNNPLSKVGVFPYSGAQIGADPSKIYQVLRPEEELSNPEALESFKLLPFIDDHEMLGSSAAGLTPAEKKGVEGVIGEEVYFKDGIVYANIKVFSEHLGDLIEAGKKQLSAGYRCMYEMASGVWNGIPYDAIQRNIRGNHLALVDEGRMGKEVAVLDKFTFDTIFNKEELQMTKEALDAKAAMDARFEKICDWAEKKIAQDEAEEEKKKDKETEDEAKRIKGLDEEKDEESEKAEDESEEEEEKKKDKKEGMDAAKLEAAMDARLEKFRKDTMVEISARNELAEKLSKHIGTFDHSEKTLAEVAFYGVEKLGIKCPKGSEKVALDGYLHGRNPSTKTFAVDSKKTGGFISDFEKTKNKE